MTEALLGRLQRTELTMLTELARQDQDNPNFVVLDWAVEPLSTEGFGGNGMEHS
jgi:hypothetical protein